MNGKVLQLCSYYRGSAVYGHLFSALDTLGVSSTVYVFTPKERGAAFQEENNVLVSPCFRQRDRYLFHWKHRKVLRDLLSRVDVASFAVVHAHSLFSNGYLAYRLHRRYGIPYVVAVRNTDVHVFFQRMPHLRPLGRRILLHAEKVVFLSGAYRDTVLKKYVPRHARQAFLDKVEVIPNGIDDYWHEHPGLPRTRSTEQPVKLLYVGAVSEKKNLSAAMAAVELLYAEGLDATLQVAGPVREEGLLARMLEDPHTHYRGVLPKDALLALYRSSDLFVLPSKYETFGLVYGEAMSQGLPVIYTRGQGFDGQFEEGAAGFGVDATSPTEIAEKIRSILGDYEGFSQRALALSKRFRWGDIARTYQELYARARR